MNTESEQVLVVDADNRPQGSVSRNRLRCERLIYRATYILVRNAEGAILVQQRSRSKDMYPGFYDAAAGGVVQAEESYQESALREVEEELGLAKALLERQFDFYFEDADNRVWGRVFLCRHEGPFRLQTEEIDDAFFCSVGRLLDGELEPLTPDSLYALRCYHSGVTNL